MDITRAALARASVWCVPTPVQQREAAGMSLDSAWSRGLEQGQRQWWNGARPLARRRSGDDRPGCAMATGGPGKTGVADFGILGPLEVVRDGRPVPLGGPRQRSVLALLLLEA